MPLLDVTDVLDDPDFNESFNVIRRTRTVDEFGRGVVTEEIIPLNGVVQPASSRTLERINIGDWKLGGIDVWCRKDIKLNTDGNLPDEIEWGGSRYMVVGDQDWSHYASGYWEVVAVLTLGESGYNQ